MSIVNKSLAERRIYVAADFVERSCMIWKCHIIEVLHHRDSHFSFEIVLGVFNRVSTDIRSMDQCSTPRNRENSLGFLWILITWAQKLFLSCFLQWIGPFWLCCSVLVPWLQIRHIPSNLFSGQWPKWSELTYFPYIEILKQLDLQSLETCRVRRDINKGFICVMLIN